MSTADQPQLIKTNRLIINTQHISNWTNTPSLQDFLMKDVTFPTAKNDLAAGEYTLYLQKKKHISTGHMVKTNATRVGGVHIQPQLGTVGGRKQHTLR